MSSTPIATVDQVQAVLADYDDSPNGNAFASISEGEVRRAISRTLRLPGLIRAELDRKETERVEAIALMVRYQRKMGESFFTSDQPDSYSADGVSQRGRLAKYCPESYDILRAAGMIRTMGYVSGGARDLDLGWETVETLEWSP